MLSTLIGLPRVEGAVERLDLPGADPVDVAASLDDLARINRRFGGTSLTLRALERLLGRRGLGQVTLLDAGCGGGDLAQAMADWARRRGFVPRVVAVDASPQLAALAFDRVGSDVEVHVGDVRALELDDASVDVATCSLLVHHLEPPDAVVALGELGRVARRGIVVNDLVRTRTGLVGAHLVGRLLARSPITRHDAVVSVRRAYTRGELLELVRQAGLRPVDLRGRLGYRIALVAEPR